MAPPARRSIEKHSLESTALGAVVLASTAVWLILIFTGPGLVMIPGLAFSIWLGQELLVAQSTTAAVKIGPNQLPKIWAAYQAVGKRLGITDLPPLYLQQQGGVLNAFAAKAARKRQVMLNSALVESADDGALAFILAHELGHHEAEHTSLLKALLLAPLDLIGFGSVLHFALSRGQEFTADRYGLAGCGSLEDAERAMLVLMAGRLGQQANAQTVTDQRSNLSIWNHLAELVSTHPNCIRRIDHLRELSRSMPT